MGGQREDTIKTSSAQKKSTTIQESLEQSITQVPIRFHEDPKTGQIHFHDDTNKLKVAMPVADWFTAWRKIKQANNTESYYSWIYFDPINNTMLTVNSGISISINPPLFECSLSISSIQFSDTYRKLENFTFTKYRVPSL